MPNNKQEQAMKTRKENTDRLSYAMDNSRIGTDIFRAAFKQEAVRLQKLVTDIAALESSFEKNASQLKDDECANIQKYIDTTNTRIDAMAYLLNATEEGVTRYKTHLKAGAMESVLAVNAMLNGIVMEIQNQPGQATEYFEKSKTFAERAKKLDILAVQGGKSYALETLTSEEFNVLNNHPNIKEYLKDATSNNYKQVIFNKREFDELKDVIRTATVSLDKKDKNLLIEKLVEGKEEELSSGFRQAICLMIDVLVAIPVFLITTGFAVVFGALGCLGLKPEAAVIPIVGAAFIMRGVDDLIKEAASETEHLDVLKETASLKTSSLVEPKDTTENNAAEQIAPSPNLNADPPSGLKEQIKALKETAVVPPTSSTPQNKI